MWAHALALLIVLLTLVPLIGTQVAIASDEGAWVFQAKALSDDRTWTISHPFPEVDREGAYFPLTLSERREDGWVTVAKRPTYALVLAGADRAGGTAAMFVLSAIATWAAAVAAALIARRLRPDIERAALWATGLATPLLFYSFLVLGHTLATALCGWAALGLLSYRESGHKLILFATGVATAAAVLTRTEALAFSAAIVITLVVVVIRGRRPRDLAALMVIGGATLGAQLVNDVWYRAIVPAGGLEVPAAYADQESFLGARWSGFTRSWLEPGYAPFGPRHVFVLFAAVGILVAVVWWRARPRDPNLGTLLAVGSAACAIAAVALDDAGVVPGLLLASPLLLCGLVAARRSVLEGAGALLVAIVGLYCAAVVMTQYGSGGSYQWGGRYFAPVLPLAMPLALAALASVITRLDAATRRAAIACLAVVALAPGVIALETLRTSHQDNERVLEGAAHAAEKTRPGDGGLPVVVTTDEDVGRFTWPVSDRTRWLWSRSDDDLRELVGRLSDYGIEEFVLATIIDPDAETELAPEYRVTDRIEVGRWTFALVAANMRSGTGSGR